MDPNVDTSVPQWKRDLILRIRQKNKWPSDDQQQLLAGSERNTSATVGGTGQQPSPTSTCSSAAAVPIAHLKVVNGVTVKCKEDPSTCTCSKMVKEEIFDSEDTDSGSSEELHYGPGIVNKLKNRYLSLTLRENNVKVRPSILPMRKATSLEHLLDDEDDDIPNGKPPITNSRIFQSRYKENEIKNGSNRYYKSALGSDLKRARSVETISRNDDQQENDPLDHFNKHKSLHEDILIVKEGNDKHFRKIYDKKTMEITTETKQFSTAVNRIINRPKRITPIMSEKEKPPVDVVKQTKKIFEGKAEHRTRTPYQTGEVAAKVATYKSIIGQTRSNNKKPPLPKHKPIITQLPLNKTENGWTSPDEKIRSPDVTIPSPIPDISSVNSINNKEESKGSNRECKNGTNLSETPDLILHSSPVKKVSSPTFRILATDNFLKAEVAHSNVNSFKIKRNHETEKPKISPPVPKPRLLSPNADEKKNECKTITNESRNNIQQAGSTVTYNLSSSSHGSRSHLPTIKKETLANSKPTNGNQTGNKNTHTFNNKNTEKTATNGNILSPTSISKPLSPTATQSTNLTPQEIEKNHINSTKTLKQTVVTSPVPVKREEFKKIEVPKTTLPRESKEQNSVVFKFTDRKDVPDYVGNDGRIRTGKIEKPKVGEGGIILLPGASLDESVTDDDDDWMSSLEGPPSPCDVVFINDNVLIDGRSSLSQKNKKSKLRLKFVDAVPEIFEYPSEASFMGDVPAPPPRETSPGHIVPTLSGSSLANYIPKSGSSEDFQLGITRSIPTPQPINENKNDETVTDSTLKEIEEPVLFSAGTNSDILF